MATALDLTVLQPPKLVRFEPRRRGKGVMRSLYLVPEMHEYFTTGMAGLVADRAQLVTPKAAAHRCFESFCLNEPFAWATADHNGYNQLDGGVWELKTFDVRAIGFFWRKGMFIVTAIKLKKELKKAKCYAPFIKAAKHHMQTLGLDPPRCVEGVKYAELF